MYALDTNTLIYFFKGMGEVGRRLLEASPSDVAVPAIVLHELETGIAKSFDPARRRAQLDAMLTVVKILPFGREEARVSAAIRAELEALGTPIGPLDTLIAGTAARHDAVLVTRNVREFGRVRGLRVEDWYGTP